MNPGQITGSEVPRAPMLPNPQARPAQPSPGTGPAEEKSIKHRCSNFFMHSHIAVLLLHTAPHESDKDAPFNALNHPSFSTPFKRPWVRQGRWHLKRNGGILLHGCNNDGHTMQAIFHIFLFLQVYSAVLAIIFFYLMQVNVIPTRIDTIKNVILCSFLIHGHWSEMKNGHA